MGEIPRSFHETVPAAAFAPGEFARQVAQQHRDATLAHDTPPQFERSGLAEQLRLLGYPAPPLRSRFEIDGLLGAGANGRVYAATDHDLERAVAVKMLAEARPSPETLARFVAEARITAALDHPNVLPVHDLEVTSRGQVFFTTKRIRGRSLGAAIDESSPPRRMAPLDDPNAVVSVFIGVCQALALAHRQGIVHQDVKPDNIMLGDFGEVLLVDWGSARRLDRDGEGHIYGTPLYMSPEQARRELPDRRSDVYCIGATLFHALVLRPPCWNDDEQRFWAMKAAGELQPPTAEELAGVPAPLLAIALRALSPQPEDRYADASALLEDLRRYQSGLAVSAWREPWWSRLRRWHGRNQRTVWAWTAAAAVVVALAAALRVESLKEVARWGEPRVVESFADDSWKTRWLPMDGSFATRDGRLVSTGPFVNIVMLNRRLRGAIAVEYTAEMLPGGHPCDISLVWARGIELDPDGRRVAKLDQVHEMQVGAFDGSYTTISEGIDQPLNLAVSDFRPLPGRRYRVRVEVVDNRLTLAVDGRRLCEWDDSFPFAGGYVGLYGFYPDKAFSDLRIYQREVPEKVPATAIGDATARAGEYTLAADQYAEVAESHPGGELAREALWKEGLCWWRAAQHDRAREVWRSLSGTGREDLVRTYDVEQLLADGDAAGALATIDRQYPSAGREARERLAMLWAQGVRALKMPEQRALMEAYLGLHDRCFADQTAVDAAACNALLALGREEELLRRYPYQRFLCTQALGILGRQDVVARDYPDQRAVHAVSCFLIADYASLDRDPDAMRGMWVESLWHRGRGEEALAAAGTEPSQHAQSLIALGRNEEVIADPATHTYERGIALCAAGRAAEAAASDDRSEHRFGLLALGDTAGIRAFAGSDAGLLRWADCAESIAALIDGDPGRARRLFGEPIDSTDLQYHYWICQLISAAAIGTAGGDPALLDRVCAQALGHRWYEFQRPWYDAAYLSGRIDERGFLGQPFQAWMKARLLLLRAVREERAGEAVAALADLRAFAALPRWQHLQHADGAVERYVAWRIDRLSAR